MPKLGRTTPCAECPWLRRSARGYLGTDDPEHFYRVSVAQEQHMPCHMEIDYEDPDWLDNQMSDVDYCAGNLIYYRNHCKRPRNPVLNAAVNAVKASPHVFSWAIEFITHHMPMENDPEKLCMAAKRAEWPYEQ